MARKQRMSGHRDLIQRPVVIPLAYPLHNKHSCTLPHPRLQEQRPSHTQGDSNGNTNISHKPLPSAVRANFWKKTIQIKRLPHTHMHPLTRLRSRQIAISERLPIWCTADLIGLFAHALFKRQPNNESCMQHIHAIRAFVRFRSVSSQTRAWTAVACEDLLKCTLRVRCTPLLTRYMAGIMRVWPHLLSDTATIHQLIIHKEIPVVRLLRRCGYDINTPAPCTGRTALMEVARAGRCVLFMHLIDRRRADPNAIDANGWTVSQHIAHMAKTHADNSMVQHRCRIMQRLLDRKDRAIRRFVKGMSRNHRS